MGRKNGCHDVHRLAKGVLQGMAMVISNELAPTQPRVNESFLRFSVKELSSQLRLDFGRSTVYDD
ncbi:unnamed protein product [Dovyalis caffra]|uniref:Uncharacterized protein n=1 Tax=Dovyalis caffra TaxID=77055 RepID=A0AAV1RHP4_9ROSI|nr:unnamed protein product [Dovyalis caffra]